MIDPNLFVRRAVITMWITTAFTFGLNIYAVLTRNPVSIGVGLGVALSYTVAGIVLGVFAARTNAGNSSRASARARSTLVEAPTVL